LTILSPDPNTNAKHAAGLLESGRLLTGAENLRGLIAYVGAVVADGSLDLSADQLPTRSIGSIMRPTSWIR